MKKITQTIRLPSLMVWPIRFIPPWIHPTILITVLNQVLYQSLQRGELTFLHQRTVLIHVTDAPMNACLTVVGNKFIRGQHQKVDLLIEGTTYDFLLLATGREDADTLFFNRRLRLEGETELGLYVKNFLATQEPQQLLGPLFKLLQIATYGVERLAHFRNS